MPPRETESRRADKRTFMRKHSITRRETGSTTAKEETEPASGLPARRRRRTRSTSPFVECLATVTDVVVLLGIEQRVAVSPIGFRFPSSTKARPRPQKHAAELFGTDTENFPDNFLLHLLGHNVSLS